MMTRKTLLTFWLYYLAYVLLELLFRGVISFFDSSLWQAGQLTFTNRLFLPSGAFFGFIIYKALGLRKVRLVLVVLAYILLMGFLGDSRRDIILSLPIWLYVSLILVLGLVCYFLIRALAEGKHEDDKGGSDHV